MNKFVIITVFVTALTLWTIVFLAAAVGASAQTATCYDRKALIAKLDERFGETRRSAGLAEALGMVAIFEVWASDTTGTWTLLKSLPNGETCVVATGEGWQDFPAVVSGDPA